MLLDLLVLCHPTVSVYASEVERVQIHWQITTDILVMYTYIRYTYVTCRRIYSSAIISIKFPRARIKNSSSIMPMYLQYITLTHQIMQFAFKLKRTAQLSSNNSKLL